MKAKQLHMTDENGNPMSFRGYVPNPWVCGVCGYIYDEKERADSCCVCSECGTATRLSGRTICQGCRDKADDVRIKTRLLNTYKKAEKIPLSKSDCDIYYDDDRSEFFNDSPEEYLENLIEDEVFDKIPDQTFIYETIPCHPGISVSDVENYLYDEIENQMHNVDEGVDRDFPEMPEELKVLLKTYLDKVSKSITWFEPNYNRAIVFDK